MSRGDNGVISDDPLKSMESNTSMSQHSSDMKINSRRRLAGGADATSNTNASDNDINVEVTPVPSEAPRTTPGAEKESDAIIMESNNYVKENTVSDKKVNEMIDYVIQNLQEAEKALTSLGQNFEHDLKLMFVDVMGKVQNWVGLAQIRIDSAKTDLSSLGRELVARSNEVAARDRELADLRSKLTESEVARGAYEKALTESVQRRSGPLTSPSTMTFVPSRQPMPTGVPSTSSAMDRGGLSEVQSGVQSGVQSEVQSGVQSGVPSAYPIAAEMSPEELGYIESQRAGGIPSMRTVGRPDDPSTADVAIQSDKTRERSKRDSELESEVSRLRKEMERIMKERTDYENSIQRALLRGVSSLNAETLRVLRCPPTGCYTPCGPPPSPVNTVETMIPCGPKKTRDNWTPRSCKTRTNSSTKQGSSRAKSNATAVPETENNCCGSKRQSAGIHGSCSKPKKSPVTSDQSMIFLLHEADASSVCLPGNMKRIRSCGATKLKKLDTSVCVKKLG